MQVRVTDSVVQAATQAPAVGQLPVDSGSFVAPTVLQNHQMMTVEPRMYFLDTLPR